MPTPADPVRVSHGARLEELLGGVVDKYRRALAAYQTFQQVISNNTWNLHTVDRAVAAKRNKDMELK